MPCQAPARLEGDDGGVGVVAVLLLQRGLEGAELGGVHTVNASLPRARGERVGWSGPASGRVVNEGGRDGRSDPVHHLEGAGGGLEERAVESFNEAIGLYGRMQQEGRIESFDVALLNLTGDLGGYLQLNGTAQQLAAVNEDEEFRRHLVAASLVVDDLRMFHGATNAGVAEQMAMYTEAAARFRRTPERRVRAGRFRPPRGGGSMDGDDGSRSPPRRPHRHGPLAADRGPGRPPRLDAGGALERLRPPRAGRPRVAAPLVAQAGALRRSRVHVRGGPLPGL